MLKVLFFARVKEQLGCAAMDLAFNESLADLDSLQEHLCRQGGPVWREVLEQDNMIRAINQVIVSDNRALLDGDEVAFFPPVTGG